VTARTVAPALATPPSTTVTSPAELKALQEEFVNVVKAVGPSVVQIETQQGLGSGIIFDSQGDIVTNAHVVGSSQQFTVTLASGREYSGHLVGTFAADDLAVIKIEGANFPAATFADSAALQVGDIVMAIGNPLGLQSSVTEGIVSAVGRTLTEQNGATLNDLVQTSAAINPGNSGGALVDLQGRVVGIPTLAATTGTTRRLVRAWNTLPISATLAPNTAYWLMYNTNGSSAALNNLHYDPSSSAGEAWNVSATPFGAWPASFGPAVTTSGAFSIYASYTP